MGRQEVKKKERKERKMRRRRRKKRQKPLPHSHRLSWMVKEKKMITIYKNRSTDVTT